MSSVSKSSGMARLLAMLVTLLTIFSLCAAAPTATSENVEGKQLAIRAPVALKAENAVRMGETKYFPFGLLSKSYGSAAFASCIGVLIVGNKGAIVGHYTVTGTQLGVAVPNDPLDTHLTVAGDTAAAKKIPALYTANVKAFKEGLQVFMYTQLNADNTEKFPAQTAALAAVIHTATGVQPTLKHYSQATADSTGGQITVTNKVLPGYTTDFVV